MKENLIKCLLRTRFLTKIQSMMWCNYDSKIKKMKIEEVHWMVPNNEHNKKNS